MTDRGRALLDRLGAGLAAGAVFALAFFSPSQTVDSDPGIALLLSQTLLDHRTFALDVHRGDPALAYDLDTDYRLRRIDGVTTYYSPSVAVLSLPFVWVANRLGYHMLDHGTELAAQNLFSALCCAAIFLILYGVCRAYLDPPSSWVITAVTVLGSPLISTLATGLWNAAYASVLLSLVVLHLARRDAADRSPSYPYLALVLGLAFVARPSAAFAALALAASLLATGDRRVARVAGGLLGLLIAAVAAAWAGWMDWLPTAAYYYSPTRLFPRTSLGLGLAGTVWSPSRGLLVFCPFVALVLAAAAWRFADLRRHRLFLFALAWIALSIPAIATRPIWWGGHSFGPRLYTELMPAFLLLTALLWRNLRAALERRPRTLAAAAYGLLGAFAVAVHAGQGLFNPYAQQWNTLPDVDSDPKLVLDWRYPQLLASEELLERRIVERQRRTFGTYVMGEELAHDSPDLLFRQWYPAEADWRWSRGTESSFTVRLPTLGSAPLYLLALKHGTLGRQDVALELDGTPLDRWTSPGFGPTRRLILIAGHLLKSERENTFRIHVPGAEGTETDPRRLGLALGSLSLTPVEADFTSITHRDEAFFLEGWSGPEAGWRWSDGSAAVLALPAADLDPGPHLLELTAGTLGRQRFPVSIDGTDLGELVLEGFEPTTLHLEIPAGLLHPGTVHQLRIETPDATTPDGETRRLGLAFVSITWMYDDSSGDES